jgi:excinuclease ABC subunit A
MIKIQGASEHNLKDVDVEIGDGLTVVTGISGSGKTSLVFDTLYHEARRRLYNVISTSRPGGWMNQLAPAKVESITGLGPAIAVGQNILNRNPLSTLASASGLHPFLRLLYTNYGIRQCPDCGVRLNVLSEDEIVEYLHRLASQSTVRISVPLLRGICGSHSTLLALLSAQFGEERLGVDDKSWDGQPLQPDAAHDLDVFIGELESTASIADIRLMVQSAAALGVQSISARTASDEIALTSAPVCVGCGRWFQELEPKHFHMPCQYCQGQGCDRCARSGMHPLAYGVKWENLRLPDLLKLSVDQAWELFSQAELPSTSVRLLSEIDRRLEALNRVGLGYLSLNRSSPTLSRGESQRVRLAVALTGRLEDLLHVLDEPTIGQHPADVARFLPAFRDLAGPVVYVEHDRIAAAAADHVIDLGPGAGIQGGEVVFEGTPAELWGSLTPSGRYFSLRDRVMTPDRRPPPDKFLTLLGAHQHNLQDIDVRIPIGRLTVVTGVSGSGKSTLVGHVLVPSLKNGTPIGCKKIQGPSMKVVLVDQSPIGRNPRSNPATYTKFSDILRELYAEVTGLSPSHFSFNRPEGACPTCKGMGAVEVKMQYLYSVWIPCEDCESSRFNEQVLSAKVSFDGRHLSIADFYELSIYEVRELFVDENRLPEKRINAARRILRALTDVGLGYLSLGQPSPSLSGGEAQRVKLTKFLGRGRLQDRLLVLDEPSTGLHPQDLDGLLMVLDRLVRAGATIVVVEHNTDIIRSADWIIDLGPGAGPAGGRVLYCGPGEGLVDAVGSITARALLEEVSLKPNAEARASTSERDNVISIRNARANNLKGVDVDIPKGKLTVVTGLSGSGKSSLVKDILEVEARRRYLESLSVFERQGTREGPEAPVDSISGLGVTLSITSQQVHRWSALSHFTRRASVGRATELNHHLSILLAELGGRKCQRCGDSMRRAQVWECRTCAETAVIASPRHFSTFNYASVCDQCTGVGVVYKPRPEKLIIHPEKPLCGGAMYSPGYWPETYLCKDTGIIQALAERYDFDPSATAWEQMSENARKAFLFGDAEPMECTYRSKSTGKRAGRLITHTLKWEGFYGGWVRDWDVHGTYTESIDCPTCLGAGLKDEYLAVKLVGYDIHELSEMPLTQLLGVIENLSVRENSESDPINISKQIVERRLRFLCQVGLGYLHLNRTTGTLSAGEAQRIQLAGLLGSQLTSLTVLLDEPSRGMHPSELDALRVALEDLRNEGNTLVIVEHDLQIIRAADHIIDIGPGAGTAGGKVIAQGTPDEIAKSATYTGKWLLYEKGLSKSKNTLAKSIDGYPHQQLLRGDIRQPVGVLTITGARENNLQDVEVNIPLGILVGFCGVSGSGKSTLMIDTLGRALVWQTHTTSFANEPMDPGMYDSINGAPGRTVLVDQSRKNIRSPANYLGITKPLVKLYAESPEAQALGLDESLLSRSCTSCKGRGAIRLEMGFLPDIFSECEICKGTGYRPEAWDVCIQGVALPEVNALTLDEVYHLFTEYDRIARPLKVARDVGLGYLVWRQPGFTMSGGEAQRLKIVKELLYILDEPTVGQHMHDVSKLLDVLNRLVYEGNSVAVIEHHPMVLAACDWLIELGPGGGPDGGRVVAAGTPQEVARMDTPTAPYLREILRDDR